MTRIPKVLIVDDEPRMCDSLYVLLAQGGCQPLKCYNAEQAIQCLAGEEVDVVLLDMVMPEMGGLELLKRIKYKAPETQAIIMTGYPSVETAVAAVRNGAFDYIKKPFEYEDLLRVLRNAFRHKILERERKKSEEALLESEARFRRLVESSSDWIWEVNTDVVYTYVSPKIEEILGYKPEEVTGRRPFDLMPPEEAERMKTAFRSALAKEEPIVTLENVSKHRDGNLVTIETGAVPIFDLHGELKGYQGVNRDITERKRAETERKRLQDQLQEAKKMEAIATLAGGIAHQFNNALTPITVNLQLLEMDMVESEKSANYIKAMKDSTQRIVQLTNQLLAYARGGKYQAGIIYLDEFVKDTLPLLYHTIDSSIHVETDFFHDVSRVRADTVQLQMVLSAILSNASESIEGIGYIRISIHNEDVSRDFARGCPGLQPGRYVCLKIEDNGKGMDEETRTRVFEPFFSTKFQGRGLGMAAVYGIIRNHGGWISLDSEMGRGTVVQIYLPVVETA